METSAVEVSDLSLCVRRDGRAGSTPFVFWHGLGLAGNGGFLDIAAPPLVEAGYATVALDAPGFGGSSPLPRDAYTIDRLAGLLWELVDALELARPVVLAGHSWGGAIAVTAASQRPADVRALVLFDSGHVNYADWPDARPDATIDELIAEVDAEPMPATWDELVSLLAENKLDQDWTLAAWRNGFDAAPDGGLRRLASREVLAASRAGLMHKRVSDGWPTIAAAGIPTLVLLATEPEEIREINASAAERMHAAIPHVDIRPIAGMRHTLFADLGEATGTIVAEWLGILGGRPSAS